MAKKLLIVGGVAGGASAAARARRVDESAEIILFERGEYISFANCGLPYYIGNVIKERDDLLVTTPELLKNRFNIDVRVFSEVMSIDRDKKEVEIKNHQSGEIYTESYDKLILSPGAEPIRPPLDGIDLPRIFTLRNIPDTDKVKAYVDDKKPGRAVIVGGGFIGLEMAESLKDRGVDVTIVEMLNQVMAPIDYEMATMVHEHLMAKDVKLRLGEGVKSFREDGDTLVVTTDKGDVPCDMVILSIGVRPENKLAKDAGLDVGERGGIVVDDHLRTNDPDIYAVGDAVEIKDFVLGGKTQIPLAGPANKQGRIAADNAFGRDSKFNGTQGTAVVKVFDFTVAATGMNEKMLKRLEIPYKASYTHSMDHAGYYPGAEMMALKLLFAPDTGKVLGAQSVRKGGRAKRIDVIATAIRAGMTVYDLEELELSYAPPFGSAKDPVNMAGFVAANILKGDVEVITPYEFIDMNLDGHVLLDVRSAEEIKDMPMIDGAINIPIDELRGRLGELDKSKTIIPYCAIGLRGYLACRILTQTGFKAINLSGGRKSYVFAKK